MIQDIEKCNVCLKNGKTVSNASVGETTEWLKVLTQRNTILTSSNNADLV